MRVDQHDPNPEGSGLHRHLQAAGAGADDANVGSYRLRHALPLIRAAAPAWFSDSRNQGAIHEK